MMSQTHILLAGALLAKPADTTNDRLRNGALVLGSFLPDAAIYILFGWSKIAGIPERQVWDEIYFSEVWQDWVAAGNAIDGAATVVNTSSLGMSGSAEFRVPLDGLRTDAVVNDLVYNPLETAFLRKAAEHGCQVVDGLGMLLYQAAPGFERWFGLRPEVDDDTRRVVLGQG